MLYFRFHPSILHHSHKHLFKNRDLFLIESTGIKPSRKKNAASISTWVFILPLFKRFNLPLSSELWLYLTHKCGKCTFIVCVIPTWRVTLSCHEYYFYVIHGNLNMNVLNYKVLTENILKLKKDICQERFLIKIELFNVSLKAKHF